MGKNLLLWHRSPREVVQCLRSAGRLAPKTSKIWLLTFVRKPTRDGKLSKRGRRLQKWQVAKTVNEKDKTLQLVSGLSRFFRSIDRDRSPVSCGICMASNFSAED